MRDVLITPEEVLYHAPSKHEMDPRMISQSIIVAEERFIRSEIGFNMYDYMVSQKNTVVNAGNIAMLQTKMPDTITLVEGDVVNALEFLNPSYQALWKQQLWKLTSECVMMSAFPESYVQFTAQGAVHNNPPAGLMVTSGFVTPLLPSMKWMMDKKMQDRVSPLVESLHNFICKYKTVNGYDLYNKACPDCTPNGEPEPKKFAGIAQGIYDEVDHETKWCCED